MFNYCLGAQPRYFLKSFFCLTFVSFLFWFALLVFEICFWFCCFFCTGQQLSVLVWFQGSSSQQVSFSRCMILQRFWSGRLIRRATRFDVAELLLVGRMFSAGRISGELFPTSFLPDIRFSKDFSRGWISHNRRCLILRSFCAGCLS